MTGADPSLDSDQRTWAARLFAVSTMVYLALAATALKGIRGSDQYWYSGEMESLLAGRAPFSNFFFVGAIWRNGQVEGTNVFAHHTAVHYMALPLASVLGTYWGWVLTGLALTVLSVVLLRWLIVDATGSSWAGAIGGAVYLLSPLVYWNSVNMLQESYQAAVVVLLGYCVYRSVGRARWGWACLVVLAVGCGVHPIFKLATLGYVCSAAWVIGPTVTLRVRLLISACAFLVLVGSMWAVPVLFPTTPTHSSIISASEGITNCAGYLEYDLVEPSIGLILRKTVRSAVQHLTILASSAGVFYIVFYITLFGLGAFGVIVRRSRDKRLGVLFGLTLLMLAGYVGLTSLHQVQPRYMLLVYPLSFAATVVAVTSALAPGGRWAGRGGRPLTAVLAGTALITVGSMGVDALMARRLRSLATTEAADIQRMRSLLKPIDLAGPVLGLVSAESPGAGNFLGYASSPRPYMSVLPALLDDERTAGILEMFGPKALLAEPEIADVPAKLEHLGWALRRVGESEEFILYAMSPLPAGQR